VKGWEDENPYCVRGAVNFSMIISTLYSWFMRPDVATHKPFWDSVADYALGFLVTFIKAFAVSAFISFGAVVTASLLAENSDRAINTKLGRNLFRMGLMIFLFAVLPLIQVSCERGFN